MIKDHIQGFNQSLIRKKIKAMICKRPGIFKTINKY